MKIAKILIPLLTILLIINIPTPIKASQYSTPTPVGTGDFVLAMPPLYTAPQNTDANGNTVYAQAYGYMVNPLDVQDPLYNYYLFDFSVTVTPGPGWSVDTYGDQDPNGASIQLIVGLQNSSLGNIVSNQIQPSTGVVWKTGQPAVNFSINGGYGGVSAGIGITFTPAQSQSIETSPNPVQWASGFCTYLDGACLPGWTYHSAYQYEFECLIQAVKGNPLQLAINATGNFFEGSNHAHVHLLANPTFQEPPIVTVSSDPTTGIGYVTVDNKSVRTPAEYVWYQGDTHGLDAAETVPAEIGVQYQFVGWSNGGPISQIITVPEYNATYTANYQKQDLLTIGTPSDGSTDPGPGSYWRNDGATQTIVAIPNSGFYFSHWVVDGSDVGGNSKLNVTMNNPHTIEPMFSSEPSVIISAGTGGSVRVESSVINYGVAVIVTSDSQQTISVPFGSVATLVASPNVGYSFDSWSGTQSSTSAVLNITVNANIQEAAGFSQPSSNTQTTASASSTSSSSSTGQSTSTTGIQTSTTNPPQSPPPGNTTTGVGNSAFSFSIIDQQVAFVAAAAIIGVILIVGSILLFQRRKNI